MPTEKGFERSELKYKYWDGFAVAIDNHVIIVDGPIGELLFRPIRLISLGLCFLIAIESQS